MVNINTDYGSTNDIYSITVVCSNCNERKLINIPKGTVVSSVACPNCGCKTLRRYP